MICFLISARNAGVCKLCRKDDGDYWLGVTDVGNFIMQLVLVLIITKQSLTISIVSNPFTEEVVRLQGCDKHCVLVKTI